MGAIDLTESIADQRNVLLIAEGGAIVFFCLEPGVYEVHTNFLPDHRGKHALSASLAAYRWMFTNTDCMVILTRIPVPNLAADVWARVAGFTLEFRRNKIWPTDTGLVDMKFYALRYDDWVRQTPSLSDIGKRFHEKLDSERLRLLAPQEGHSDEECHDRHVGASVEMIHGGQPEKAVILYNRWAIFAGYRLVSLIARDPLMFDIGDAVLQVCDGEFKVLLFR